MTKGKPRQAVDQTRDQAQHDVVGPVQIGQPQHDRPLPGAGLEVGAHRTRRFKARRRRISVAQRRFEADQMQQAGHRPLYLGLGAVDIEGLRNSLCHPLFRFDLRGLRRDPQRNPHRLSDRPPDVSFAVWHAATRQHQDFLLCEDSFNCLLCEAGLADTGVAEKQDERGTSASHGTVNGLPQYAEFSFTSYERGHRPDAPLARKAIRRDSAKGLDWQIFPLGLDEPGGLITDDRRGGVVGRAPDKYVAGIGGGLQTGSHVDCIAEGRELAIGAN